MDNRKLHTAKAVRSWLKDHNVTAMEWPTHSHDINPIEEMWNIIDWRSKNRTPRSAADLEALLKRQWEGLREIEWPKLMAGMRDKCLAVIEKKGRPIA
jgi:transposase